MLQMVKAWLLCPEDRVVRPVEFSRESVQVSADDRLLYTSTSVIEGVAVEDFLAAKTLIRGSGVVAVYILHETFSSRYALFVGTNQSLGFRVQPTAKAGISRFFSGRAVLIRTCKRREGFGETGYVMPGVVVEAMQNVHLTSVANYSAPELRSMSKIPVVQWMRRPDELQPYEMFRLDSRRGPILVSQLLKFCVMCEKEDSQLKSCGKCKQALYCSRECQKKHWKIHKISCSEP